MDGVAFVASRAQIGAAHNPMPKLLLTNTKGKQHSANLVSASNSQQPNESQVRELEQINRRLPPDILAKMSARRLAIPPREIGLLLSRLKADADLNLTLGD